MNLNDVGAALELTLLDDCVASNLSGVDSIIFKLSKPDGTKLSKTGSLVTDGLDGKVRYITQAGDIDQAGLWLVQVELSTASGHLVRSDVADFYVGSGL